jgi:uncharacterized membrane protein
MWNGPGSHWNAMGWDGGIWPWFMGFHGIFWILITMLIVFWIVSLIRDWRRNPARDAVFSVLAEEYARGRIDRQEYLRRKEDLS